MWKICEKTCLITGATSGIGKQTALALTRQGAKVIFTYRNEKKAIETQKFIESETGTKPEMYYCDLSSFDSIRSFTEQFKSKHQRLDVLINNAGIWEPHRTLSVDGIEMNFATNHLSPFLLTNLLLDLLIKSNPARIINVASGAHKNVEIKFDDIEMKQNFRGFKSYSQSKLGNVLFTKSLAWKLAEKNVSVYCLHPGVVSTDIFKNMGKFSAGIMKLFLISPEKGAQTSIYLATANEINSPSGSYFFRKKVVSSSRISNNKEIADRLWDVSSKYIGL